jgi:hypothetical protein
MLKFNCFAPNTKKYNFKQPLDYFIYNSVPLSLDPFVVPYGIPLLTGGRLRPEDTLWNNQHRRKAEKFSFVKEKELELDKSNLK